VGFRSLIAFSLTASHRRSTCCQMLGRVSRKLRSNWTCSLGGNARMAESIASIILVDAGLVSRNFPKCNFECGQAKVWPHFYLRLSRVWLAMNSFSASIE